MAYIVPMHIKPKFTYLLTCIRLVLYRNNTVVVNNIKKLPICLRVIPHNAYRCPRESYGVKSSASIIQITRTLRSTSIRHSADTFMLDRYLIDVNPWGSLLSVSVMLLGKLYIVFNVSGLSIISDNSKWVRWHHLKCLARLNPRAIPGLTTETAIPICQILKWQKTPNFLSSPVSNGVSFVGSLEKMTLICGMFTNYYCNRSSYITSIFSKICSIHTP